MIKFLSWLEVHRLAVALLGLGSLILSKQSLADLRFGIRARVTVLMLKPSLSFLRSLILWQLISKICSLNKSGLVCQKFTQDRYSKVGSYRLDLGPM